MDSYQYIAGGYAARRCTADPHKYDDPLKGARRPTVTHVTYGSAVTHSFEMEGATLEEIADDMGVTRERIRQIEGRAMWKLRCPNYPSRRDKRNKEDYL